ncbi:MAG: tetratricopeptide repeat protein, partial [Planctomycetota bacterium]
LYDGKPVPKVIDFGVAKATEQKLTERTLFTQYGTMVGTLEYMSPEQAETSALGVDTRSDIYSLGVLLYELLTGSTPLSSKRMKEAAFAEILRLIKEEEPPKPSTRLSESGEALASISAQRHMEPAKLSKLMRGELDWIVMKTLEKDRNRRYETANGFAADVQRYLADEPVQACPPSAGYRLRKFVRRNRAALATTTLLLLMLLAAVGGVAGTIGWAVRNRTALEQQVAQDRATRQAILGKEIGRALDDAAASYQRDKLPEALAQVRRAEGLLAGGEADAELSQRVGRWREALVFALRLEEIPLERIVTVDWVMDWAASARTYQQAFRDNGLDLATLTPNAAADRIRPSIICDRLIAALDDWSLCKSGGKLAGNEQLLKVTQLADRDPLRAAFRAAYKRNDKDALAKLAVDPKISAQQPGTVHLLAVMLGDSGQVPSAVKLLEEAQQRHPADFWINYKLAFYLRRLDPPRHADAVSFYRVAVSQRPDNALVHNALGVALADAEKPAEAEAESRMALVLQPNGARTHASLGYVLLSQRKWEESRAALVRAVSIDPEYASPRISLAWLLANSPQAQFHDLPRALEHAQKAAELLPNERLRWNHLGGIQYRAGMWQQALQTLQKAEQMESTPDNYHRIYLVMANWRLEKKHEALKHWVQFVPWMDSTKQNEPLYHEERSNLRTEAEELLGQFRHLDTAFLEILRVEPNSARAQYGLADYYYRSRQWAKSAAAYVNALEIEDPIDSRTWYDAACTIVHAGDTEVYRKLCERMAKRFGQSRDPHQIVFLAHVCVLAPDALADRDRVVQLAEQRKALTKEIDIHRLWSMHVMGLAHYRSGQFEKAVASLEAAHKDPGFQMPNFKMSNWLVLAMSRHRLGQDPEAAAALQSALAEEQNEVDPQDLSVQLLFREAETLLRKQ